ncbi:MAG: hypothetical protein AMXMBFR46_03530 [Acidimicrobiia bacterium]
MHVEGRARDGYTLDPAEPPESLAQARVTVVVAPDLEVLRIASVPERPALARLVGVSAATGWRAAVAAAVPDERAAGSPLHLLLDEVAPATIIGSFPPSWWKEGTTLNELQQERPNPPPGTCTGLRPGSSALAAGESAAWTRALRPTAPPVHPDDPDGWHDIGILPLRSVHRFRRIDLWVDGATARVDSWFQDGAGDRAHGRVALHEYTVRARAERSTGLVSLVEAVPHVLPFAECPTALAGVARLTGMPLADMRARVAHTIPRLESCTHLNDALRAIGDAAELLARLEQMGG